MTPDEIERVRSELARRGIESAVVGGQVYALGRKLRPRIAPRSAGAGYQPVRPRARPDPRILAIAVYLLLGILALVVFLEPPPA